jgi:hypothetical protein
LISRISLANLSTSTLAAATHSISKPSGRIEWLVDGRIDGLCAGACTTPPIVC